MATMGERCKQRREELGIETVAELARLTAIGGHKALTRSAVTQLELGITKEMKYHSTMQLADALGVNHEWLADGTGPKIKSKANNPAWQAALSASQKMLLETFRLYGPFLEDAHCDALSGLIRSMVKNGGGDVISV